MLRARVNSILARTERQLRSSEHSFSWRNVNYRASMRYDCFCNSVRVTQVHAPSREGFLFRELIRNSRARSSHALMEPRLRQFVSRIRFFWLLFSIRERLLSRLQQRFSTVVKDSGGIVGSSMGG